MSVARTQVTPQEWARGQPALQSPGGTPASSHSHWGTPGPNGGSQAPPRPPTPCACPGHEAGWAAYPRGAGRSSPRRGTALWGRESCGGVRKGLDALGRGPWHGVERGPTSRPCTPSPSSQEVWGAGGHHGRRCPGPGDFLPRGQGGGWVLTLQLGRVEGEPDVHGQGLEGFVEFLHGLVVHLRGPDCGAGTRVSPCSPGWSAGLPLLSRAPTLPPWPSPLRFLPGQCSGSAGSQGGSPPPASGCLVPSSPWAADTARSLHSPVPTPAWHRGPESAQWYCYVMENVTCHLFSGRDS